MFLKFRVMWKILRGESVLCRVRTSGTLSLETKDVQRHLFECILLDGVNINPQEVPH